MVAWVGGTAQQSGMVRLKESGDSCGEGIFVLANLIRARDEDVVGIFHTQSIPAAAFPAAPAAPAHNLDPPHGRELERSLEEASHRADAEHERGTALQEDISRMREDAKRAEQEWNRLAQRCLAQPIPDLSCLRVLLSRIYFGEKLEVSESQFNEGNGWCCPSRWS